MLGIGLERARAHPARIEVVLSKAANVNRPEIEGRLAFGDPFGKRHAAATAGRNAEGVEAGANKDAPRLGGFAENEVPVWCEAFRAVDELLDAGGLHGRNTANGELEERLEMLDIIFKKLKLETIWKAVHAPRFRVGLISAHHQSTHLLFPIGETVRVAQRRQIWRHTIDRFGDEILVLHRNERNIDTGHTPEIARPLARADHELVASNSSLGGGDGEQAPDLRI